MRLIVFVLIMACLSFACDKKNPAEKTNTPEVVDGWRLTWSDEFEGSGAPSALKWDRPEYNRRNNDSGPDGWWLKDDSYLDGEGNLVIRCRKIPNRNDDNDGYDYSTGAVRSKGKFEQVYGKFEIRCRMPQQPGWWVAFWLMAETVGNVGLQGVDGTEIDIMEGFGWNDLINHALHWDGYGDAHKSEGEKVEKPGIRNGYHTFALEWDASQYIFLIDGEESWRSKAGGVSQVPSYVKITGEISTENWATNTHWSNDPRIAIYPDSMVVDYVRVYEKVE